MAFRIRTRSGVPAAPEAGYAKPPKATRFRPGQSGNPNGRPKKTSVLEVDSFLKKALSAKVTITRNGRSSKVPLIEAVVEKLILDAAKGSASAQRLLFRLNENREAAVVEARANSHASADELDVEDEEIVARFEEEARARAKA